MQCKNANKFSDRASLRHRVSNGKDSTHHPQLLEEAGRLKIVPPSQPLQHFSYQSRTLPDIFLGVPSEPTSVLLTELDQRWTQASLAQPSLGQGATRTHIPAGEKSSFLVPTDSADRNEGLVRPRAFRHFQNTKVFRLHQDVPLHKVQFQRQGQRHQQVWPLIEFSPVSFL